jgi:hypothetical protein
LSARRDPIASLSELTADYYRLRAEAERALALNAGNPAKKEQHLATAAELEALHLQVLAIDLYDMPTEPRDPLNLEECLYSTAKAA